MRFLQFSSRTLKRLRTLVIGIFVFGLLLYILPNLLLRLPKVQETVGKVVASTLSEELGTPVTIGQISLLPTTNITIDNVALYDSLQREILTAKELSTGVELWPLLRGEIILSAVRLFSPEIVLRKDSRTGRLNITPILERLSSNDPNSKSPTIRVHSILLRDGKFSYWIDETPKVKIEQLSAQLHRLGISEQGISAMVDRLSLRTDNGLSIEELSLQVQQRSNEIRLSNLSIRLPNSHINIPTATLRTSNQGFNIIDHISLASVDLDPKDCAPLLPQLDALEVGHLSLSAQINGRKGVLQIGDLRLSLGNKLYLRTQGLVSLQPSGGLKHLNIEVEQLQLSSALINQIPKVFPTVKLPFAPANIESLGEVRYIGHLSYERGGQIQSEGLLTSSLGKISGRVDGSVSDKGFISDLSARVQTHQLNLSPLIGSVLPFPINRIDTELHLQANYRQETSNWDWQFSGNFERIDLGQYKYRSLEIGLSKNLQDRVQIDINSKDPNIAGRIHGQLDWSGGNPKNIQLQAEGLRLRLEHILSRKGWEGDIGLQGSVVLSNTDLDTATGHIDIHQLSWKSSEREFLPISNISLLFDKVGGERSIKLSSPWAYGTLSGAYRLSDLPALVMRAIGQHLPALGLGKSERKSNSKAYAHLNLHIQSLPDTLLSQLGVKDLHLFSPLSIEGNINDEVRQLDLRLQTSKAAYGSYHIDSLQMNLQDNQLQLLASVHTPGVELNHAHLSIGSGQDSLRLNLNLGHDDVGTDNGNLQIYTLLSKQADHKKSELTAQISVLPSRLRISNETWTIAPAHITLSPKQVEVTDLAFTTTDRHLFINGSLGEQASDQIDIDLKRINLNYILRAAGVDFSMLETDLTGTVKANMEGGTLFASAKVKSDHFAVNGVDAGGIDISLGFDTKSLDINLEGVVSQPQGGQSHVAGVIRPDSPAGIDLRFDAKDLNLDFVSTFMPDIIQPFTGHGTGRLRLFGEFEHGVTVSGDAHVKDGRIGIPVLGTTYSFEHQIHLDPQHITLDGVRLYDDQGNSGLLYGDIYHEWFGNFRLDLRADQLNGVKVFDRKTIRVIPATGIAFASGRASLQGNEQGLKLSVDATSDKGTDLILDFNRTETKKQEYALSFRNLRNPVTDSISTPIEEGKKAEKPSILDMQLNLNITPEALLGMKIGAGNMNELKSRGEGSLQINVPPVGNPQVYGTYNLIEGTYIFRLEQITNKRFTLRDGGKLDFRGDPFGAQIALTASYGLTANITDLDEGLATLARRTNIPVNCLINISGGILQPQVKFAIELPGAEAEMERRVRSLMHTEDDVTRQMLYLIALGKFYTESNDLRKSEATSNWTAVASSTLSEQLSRIMGGITQNINFGTSIKTKNTYFDDTDIELLFSGSWLGNRLLFSGNLGYHDNPFLQNTYIGEFDVEYKLNPSGSIRLKGYNHYNNMYQYLRQSLTTQGVGVLFRLRFDNLGEILRPRLGKPYYTDSISPDRTAPTKSTETTPVPTQP